jgi:hypothetical protein
MDPESGAATGIRTPDINLGKVAFYRLNYRCIMGHLRLT